MREFIVAVFLACGLSSAAFAEPPVQSPPLQTPRAFLQQLNRDQADRGRSEQNRYNASLTPERRERAERLTAMANANACSQAIRTARAEGDDQVAHALIVACEERFERAYRLAAAADTGNCDQAIETARREGDAPMAEALAEICLRVQDARRDASPEALAAAAQGAAAFNLQSAMIGEWAEACVDGRSRMIYQDDGSARINSRRGRWSVENGLLVESFNLMVPGAIGDDRRLTQHSRVTRLGQYAIRKQVVYRSKGDLPPEIILYRCVD